MLDSDGFGPKSLNMSANVCFTQATLRTLNRSWFRATDGAACNRWRSARPTFGVVANAIYYMASADCQWRQLLNDFFAVETKTKQAA
jgi:transposase